MTGGTLILLNLLKACFSGIILKILIFNIHLMHPQEDADAPSKICIPGKYKCQKSLFLINFHPAHIYPLSRTPPKGTWAPMKICTNVS